MKMFLAPTYKELGSLHSHHYNNKKKLNQMNINGFSCIHQRNEVTGLLDVIWEYGEADDFGESELRSAYLRQKLNWCEHLKGDFDKS